MSLMPVWSRAVSRAATGVEDMILHIVWIGFRISRFGFVELCCFNRDGFQRLALQVRFTRTMMMLGLCLFGLVRSSSILDCLSSKLICT